MKATEKRGDSGGVKQTGTPGCARGKRRPGLHLVRLKSEEVSDG